MTVNDGSPGIKMYLNIGVVCGALAGIMHGFAEGLILSIWYNGYVFKTKSHALLLVSQILDFDGNQPSLGLDKYLGYSFVDKMPFICNSIAVYTIIGLVTGACLGVVLWAWFRLFRKSANPKRLFAFCFSFILCLSVFIYSGDLAESFLHTLTVWFKGKDVSLNPAMVISTLVAGALFSTLVIYRLTCLLTERKSGGTVTVDDDADSFWENLSRRTKIACLSVGLIVGLALILNLWIFREVTTASAIPAAQVNRSGAVMPTGSDGKDVNVILISVDSLRADHLSCYGYARKTSPNIDGITGGKIIFSNAFTTAPWTLPAHVSMLTSMYPKSHGVITDGDRLDEYRTTLADTLKKMGYATAAFVSGPYLSSRYGFNQGFDLYDDFTINFDSDEEAHKEVTSPKLNEAVQNWLGKNYRKKFFLFLHYWDVHYDFNPPVPYDTMFDPDYEGAADSRDFFHNPRINARMAPRDLAHIIALYDGEIAYTDKYIGEVFSTLKKLGVYDKTLIVLTADHGDEFFEHGGKGHRQTLYDEVLRVPLIFKFPSALDSMRDGKIQNAVSIIDIVPTILDCLGIQTGENGEIQGRSLMSLLNGGGGSDKSLVYSELEYRLAAVRSANSKLIHYLNTPKKEFYNLTNDPKEKVNLFGKGRMRDAAEREGDDAAGQSLGSAESPRDSLISLADWLNAQQQIYQALPKTGGKGKVELSESMKEQLKALGYLQ